MTTYEIIKKWFEESGEYFDFKEEGFSTIDGLFDIEDLVEKINENFSTHLEQAKKEIINEYSEFLERNGYLDSDWWQEDQTAIEGFLMSKK